VPDPVSALRNSSSSRKRAKLHLLLACLLSGMLISLLPQKHHDFCDNWPFNLAIGLTAGVALFIWIVVKAR
jgi:hypothetical protein